eukprot:TRINITY_DN31132_c0_g1_i1.p1 TRINITY_DN31132_c0_g1~~TRINITY_DN31132_c0_g1_i1.p1  ORF type:complete len:623 (+),score=98.23 TRINITY_DN31132_c0_g1_i1:87-1955(+)
MEGPLSDNLYMKGLPTGTTDDTLKVLFGGYGVVTSCKLLSAPSGMTDVAALVRMSTIEEARYLVENSAAIATRLSLPLQIRFAANTKGKSKGKMDAGDLLHEAFSAALPIADTAAAVQVASPSLPSPSVAPHSASTRLYMKGLPMGISEDQLRAVIGAYGSIASLKILKAPPGATDTACIVQMTTLASAQWLVDNLDGNIPQGLSTPVVIKFKTENWASGLAPSFVGTSSAGHMGLEGLASAALKLKTPTEGLLPSPNLFVKGLPLRIGEETIRAIFSAYGTVTSCSLLPPSPGATDASCQMSMSNTEQAKWLVNNVNGNMPLGLTDPVEIRFADNFVHAGSVAAVGSRASFVEVERSAMVPMAQLLRDDAQDGLPALSDDGPTESLYIKGLPLGITEGAIHGILSAYGSVISCKVLPSHGSDVAALVRMGTIAEAKWLVDNVNGNIPQGLATDRPISVRYAHSGLKACGKGGVRLLGAAPGALTPVTAPLAVPVTRMATLSDIPAGAAASPLAAMAFGGKPIATTSDNLYMKGFEPNITEQLVFDIMGQYGTVVSVKVLPAPPGKSPTRLCAACLVRMAHVSEAKWIVENMNGNIPAGTSTPVEVRYANNAGKGARKSSPY